MKRIDRTGKTFGYLTVVSFCDTRGGQACWNCLCKCGNTVVVRSGNLASGHTKSCGCFAREVTSDIKKVHGETGKTKEYYTWISMKMRCSNTKVHSYPLYGKRGIKVCDRWLNSYENFLADVGRAPSKKHSLDRIDVNGHYEPGNIRWATSKEQCNNKRTNNFVKFRGEVRSLKQWCEHLGMNYSTVNTRLDRGWGMKDALTRPPQRYNTG